MPLKGSRYVLFLRSTSESDLMILTGFELSNELVTPLDGDTQDVRADLPFGKYRNLGEFLFLADLYAALANSNLGILGDVYSQALQVLAVEATANGHLRITFMNVSLKDVNGYVVVVGNGRIETDLSTGDRVMPPGTTDDLEIPPRETTPHIAVLAVMFADGSIEGDPAIVTADRVAIRNKITPDSCPSIDRGRSPVAGCKHIECLR